MTSYDGWRLRVLTVVDTWSRVHRVMRVCRSATAIVVVDSLQDERRHFGLPHTIRVDQGCQFYSKELDHWACANGILGLVVVGLPIALPYVFRNTKATIALVG